MAESYRGLTIRIGGDTTKLTQALHTANQAISGTQSSMKKLSDALKMDPTRIQVAEFWKVKGDPLARALRNKFKRAKRFPAKKFQCVFSDELLTNKGADDGSESLLFNKVQVNGSIAHITAIFGFTLAGLVIKELSIPDKDPSAHS